MPGIEENLLIDKKVFPTSLSSQDIRIYWSEKLKEQSIFSAKTTSKEYLERVKELLVEFQTGIGKTDDGRDIHQSIGRMRVKMREKLSELGLIERDASGNIVERMTNLGSTIRLNLIIKTNSDMARSMSQKMNAQDPIQKILRPYFELVRDESRKVPRDWPSRWIECANLVNWKGVVLGTPRMIARTDSEIWEKLGHHFKDSIGTDIPPFCWNSGMGWKTVTAKEIEKLGLEVG